MRSSTATQFAGCTRASNIRWPDALQTGEQMNRHIPFDSRAQPDRKKVLNAYFSTPYCALRLRPLKKKRTSNGSSKSCVKKR
jgi:hypothetical protein